MKLLLLFKLGVYKVYPVSLDKNIEKIHSKWSNTLSEKEMKLYELIDEGITDDMEGYHENSLYAVFKSNDDTGIRIKWNYLDRNVVSAEMIMAVNFYSNKYYKTKHGDMLMFGDPNSVAIDVLRNTENWKHYKTENT